MTDDLRSAVRTRIERERAGVTLGSRREAEIQRAEAQQGVGSDLVDGLGTTAGYAAGRVIAQEAPQLTHEILSRVPRSIRTGVQTPAAIGAASLSLMGFRAGKPDYDKEEHYEELTKGIPLQFHDDILENDNLAAAQRARHRVLEDLARGQRISQQNSGQLAVLAGSLFDVDAPLAAFSGGAYASAKVAGVAMRAARMSRLSPRAALRLSGTAQGANAGLQAGVVVGGVDAAVRETTGWQDVANMALQSMLLGSGIGTAVKGDVRASVQAAQEEFYGRISRDDPAFRKDVDVGNMEVEPLREPVLIEDGGPDGVGAARAVPRPAPAQPVQGATPTNQEWIDGAREWRDNSGWGAQKQADDAEWWARVAQTGFMNMTTNNFNRLYQSNSAVANYLAGTVFESANGLGRGRATAATRMEYYHRRIQSFLDEDLRSAQANWARDNDVTWQGSGYHISQEGMSRFNREVMLELNARRLGRSSNPHPDIKRAADQYEMAGAEALNIGRGKDGEQAVDGFEGLPDQRGYTPYKWNGQRIRELEQAGVVTRQNIVQALAQSYRTAGMAAGKDAEAVAKAVVHRAVSKEMDMDMSVLSMLAGDGKDFIRESMVLAGMKEADADAVIQRLTGAQHNRAKESFAKSRNDVDMSATIPTADGSDLRVVDLLDNDLHGVWQRYARQMSGSAALARQGITNRAQRQEVIDALRAEQRALGEEPMDDGLLHAMFSHFNAGPVHGFGLRGGTNEGIGEAALAKRITNLALLEKLGATQIAETGVIIAQNGLSNWMQRGPMAVLNSELRAGNQAVLDDLAFLTGNIGRDHWHFAPWLDLDDVSKGDTASWLAGVDRAASVGSFVQGYTSAFNHVRAFQQRTAALGVTDKVFRVLKQAIDEGRDISAQDRARFEFDLGLGRTEIAELLDLVDSGVIEFSTRGNSTFVDRLNTDQWPTEIGENFAAAITRNMNQLVQKSMAGEQDAWMHTVAGSILMHLKTFPLQAMQKQVMRNARHFDKQSLTTVLYGMATAAVAVQVRDVLDGREQKDFGEMAKAAFNYSNMTGFIPTLVDPVMSILGMDSARVNAYGPTYDITPPVLRIANDMLRIPGALANTITGESDWYDEKALRAIPFAGTYVLSRLFD